jgi:hypothetical protein
MTSARRARRRPWLLASAALAILLLAAGVWAWLDARRSTPVSPEVALDAFRESGGAPAGPRPGVPAPGVYAYGSSGSERGGLGPVGVDRTLPPQALLTVRPAPGGYEAELALSEEHIEVARHRVAGGWATQAWRRTDITFVGVGRDDRRALEPPPRFMPLRPEVGQRWSSTYRAGALPIMATSRVLRREEVTVGGRGVPVVVVRIETETGGAHPGTRVETLWWSPDHALPVRWSIDMDIGGTVTFTSSARLRLVSTDPRT